MEHPGQKATLQRKGVFWLMILQGIQSITMGKATQQDVKLVNHITYIHRKEREQNNKSVVQETKCQSLYLGIHWVCQGFAP